MPEHEHEVPEILKSIESYHKKLNSYAEPLDLLPDSTQNFIRTYRSGYERMLAQVQQHIPFKVTECTVVEFLTYSKELERKAKQKPGKKPGSFTSNAQN